tara:strand:- start:129 stop:470 length:342 start_codon:yes stop_codon:yes gene_type:complete
LGNFDVISSYHEIPVAGAGGLDDIVVISGRVRLFHVWLTGGQRENRTITFRNGSATADILLKFDFQFTQWPTPDNDNPIPGGGIVFDSGMYFDPGNDAGVKNVETATFIYQVG